MPKAKKTTTVAQTKPDMPNYKSQKLDSKFYAAVSKVKNGQSVPDDEWMVFLAQDNAFPATLRFYLDTCVQLGADQEHCESVMRAIRRVDEWRAANPNRCKVPTARGEKLLG